MYELLDDDEERQKLSKLIGEWPADQRETAQAYLMRWSPAEAVAYLRRFIFPKVRLAA
jgi:hypothetical protein